MKEMNLRNICRVCLYLLGMLIVSLGIVFCVKCELGISPISSVPYVLSLYLPLSLGTLTMCFHLINIMIQYVLEKKAVNVKVWLQIPVAAAFGVIIDFFQEFIQVEAGNILIKLLFLVLSIFFTALGMVFMLNMQLVQNPPDGAVSRISTLTKMEMGKVKILYDSACTLLSILLSAFFLHRIAGFGLATVLSAIFVGKTLSVLQKYLGRWLKENMMHLNEMREGK